MRRLLALAVLLSVAVPAFGKSPVTRTLRIAFGNGALVLSGLRPGGSFALVGVSSDSGVTQRVAKVLTDSDNDGIVRFPATDGVLAHSIWTAVDLASGRSVTATSPGLSAARVPLRTGDITRSGVRLRMASPSLFIVRPGVGAWSGRALDRDGDGVVSIPVEKLQAAPPTIVPLARLVRGDVVFAVDEASFAYLAGTVDLLGRR